MDKEILSKKIDRYDALAEKNYFLYQESGDPRYDKANEKYEELADVYRAAYKYQLDHDEAQGRRMHNISYFIEEHIEKSQKDNYSKEEVLELAKSMKQFVI